MEILFALVLTTVAEALSQEEVKPKPPSESAIVYEKRKELVELFEQLDKDKDKKRKFFQ